MSEPQFNSPSNSPEQPSSLEQVLNELSRPDELSRDTLTSLSDGELARVFNAASQSSTASELLLRTVIPLCQDPGLACGTFRNSAMVALSLLNDTVNICGEYEQADRADAVLALGSSVLEALKTNPDRSYPAGTNIYIASLTSLVRRLDDVQVDARVPSVEVSPGLQAWMNVYQSTLFLLGDALRSPGFTPDADTREQCVNMLQDILEWQKLEPLAIEQFDPSLIRIWSRVLDLCADVGDYRLHDEVSAMTRTLIDWMFAGDDDLLVVEQGAEAAEGILEEALIECYENSVVALRACQDGLKGLDLWHLMLKIHSMKSDHWQMAFQGIAMAHVEESAPYLGRMLNRMTSPTASPAKVNELFDWLEVYLDVPGAGTLLLKSMDSRSEVQLKPERGSRLIELIEHRIQRHDREVARIERRVAGVTDPVEQRILREEAARNSERLIMPRALQYFRALVAPEAQ